MSDKHITADQFETGLRKAKSQIDTVNDIATAAKANITYATCTTDGSEKTKTIVVDDDFTLKPGTILIVKFTKQHTAGSMEFKINGFATYRVRTSDDLNIGEMYILSDSSYLFAFDGVCWRYVNVYSNRRNIRPLTWFIRGAVDTNSGSVAWDNILNLGSDDSVCNNGDFIIGFGDDGSVMIYEITGRYAYEVSFRYIGTLAKPTESTASITVDSSLDSNSTNPVQNKVINAAIEDLKNSVSEGKSAIASTLTKNGVSTTADAPFDTINTNVGTLATKKYDEGYADGAKTGGTADLPTHPASISIVTGNGTATISLTYSNTEFLKGVLITYKTGGYPTSPTDGDSVDTVGQPTSITISNLENGTEYYFRVFLYNIVEDNKYYQTDVINARITATPVVLVPLNTKNVGDIVKIRENGTLTNFIIVNKGKPSDLYDNSCNGVWVLRERAHSSRAFSADNSNDYENSDINTWLDGEYLNSIDPKIRAVIKQVKIPFKKGDGTASTGVQSGADGLACKVFLLSGYEVGFTQTTSSNFPVDGAKLSYFIEGDDTAAKGKRIGKNPDGSAVYWWLRSPYLSNTGSVWSVSTSGSHNSSVASGTTRWARPAFVLPSNLFVNLDDEVVVPDDFVPLPDTLEETDWETIAKIAETGQASEYWNIGDTKTIQLDTGEEITVRIEDFDHDDLTTGGKAPITFGMVDCLKTTRTMGSPGTNKGGWGSSTMRTFVSTLLGQLPNDLQKVIKSVTKTTSAGSKSSSLTTTEDTLWLFSYTEMNFYQNTGYSPGGEGTAYPLFMDNGSRVKKVNGSAYNWWLRSPSVLSAEGFCDVYSDGSPGYNSPNNGYGVAVGFCI